MVVGLINWIDLTAILPYYLEWLFYSSTAMEFQRLMVLRLLRLLRLFRYFRFSSFLQLSIDVLLVAVKASKEALFSLFFFFFFFMIIYSTILYFAERGQSTSTEHGSHVDICTTHACFVSRDV